MCVTRRYPDEFHLAALGAMLSAHDGIIPLAHSALTRPEMVGGGNNRKTMLVKNGDAYWVRHSRRPSGAAIGMGITDQGRQLHQLFSGVEYSDMDMRGLLRGEDQTSYDAAEPVKNVTKSCQHGEEPFTSV